MSKSNSLFSTKKKKYFHFEVILETTGRLWLQLSKFFANVSTLSAEGLIHSKHLILPPSTIVHKIDYAEQSDVQDWWNN